MDEREALIAKEAAAAAALRTIDRLVPGAWLVLVGGVLLIALYPAAGLMPFALLGITFGIVTLVLKSTRRAQLALVRRQLEALQLPPARVIRD